jgi:hypothetical protein
MKQPHLIIVGGLCMLGSAFYAAVVLTASVVSTPPVLDNENFARWRDFIRPTKEETRWAEIPWRSSFWEGVLEGQKKGQPLLIWAMNGHPLACT